MAWARRFLALWWLHYAACLLWIRCRTGSRPDGPWLIGLTPAEGGADALAAVGWNGPCNHAGVAQISAVLRSWEDRYSLRVVGAGFDTLEVSVAAPPAGIEEARHLAAEHHAL